MYPARLIPRIPPRDSKSKNSAGPQPPEVSGSRSSYSCFPVHTRLARGFKVQTSSSLIGSGYWTTSKRLSSQFSPLETLSQIHSQSRVRWDIPSSLLAIRLLGLTTPPGIPTMTDLLHAGVTSSLLHARQTVLHHPRHYGSRE